MNRRDGIADRRFDKAQAAGELAVLAHNIAGHETRIRQLQANEAALKAEGEQLDQAWQELWAEVPIEVLAPDGMLAWLEVREKVVTLTGRKSDVRRQLGDSRREEHEGIDQVRAALTKVGWDAEEIEANWAASDGRTGGRVSEGGRRKGREDRRDAQSGAGG